MTDKALAARPTMTAAELAVWAERVKLPGAGVRSAAAEAVPHYTDTLPLFPSAAAPRARVPIRRVRIRDEREVAL